MSYSYEFSETLVEGTILYKEARFVAYAQVQGKKERCFLPVTVNIGDFYINDLPCLLEKNPPGRKTTWTIKAISVDEKKSWIGIDLNFSNRLFEHFAAQGALSPLLGDYTTLKREQVLGSSKLDFKVDDLWVEIKTPVDTLHKTYGDSIKLRQEHAKIITTSEVLHEAERGEVLNAGRMEKQVKDMMSALSAGERAALLTVHQYVPDTVKAYRQTGKGQTVKETLSAAYGQGLESWVLDLEYSKDRVEFHKLAPFRISR